MKKNNILKFVLTACFVIATLAQYAFNLPSISDQELIGQGSPQLLGKGYKLRAEAHTAFINMQTAALKDGISIGAVSSYRSFAHQQRIWERKFKSNKAKGLSDLANIKKIIEYSTIPGTSRHHWGTDIDIYQTNVKQPKNVLFLKIFMTMVHIVSLKNGWMQTQQHMVFI